MNRKEFMSRLESLLRNISPAEREEALQYYNDYFDDAGAGNEQTVIETLGDPEKIAETIRGDLLREENIRKATFSNRELIPYGKTESEQAESDKREYGGRDSWDGQYAGSGSAYEPPREKEKKKPGGDMTLLIVLAVLAAPIWLPVVLGLLGALFGVLVAWFSMIFGFGVAAAALLGVLLFLIILGGMCVMLNPFVGLVLWGCGLVCGSIGLALLMLTVAMAGIATPAIFRGIAWIFGRRKKENML